MEFPAQDLTAPAFLHDERSGVRESWDDPDQRYEPNGKGLSEVGQYMELLRQKNVRLIAVNENVDSFREDDDFTPFRNIMNEWYARDTSKKIKSTFKAKGKSGKHVASTTPYGT